MRCSGGQSTSSARAYTASIASRRSAIAGTSAIAIARRRRHVAAVASRSAGCGRAGGEQLGERQVHLGGRGAEGVRALAEVLAARGGVQSDAPGVLDAGEELLREGERARHGPVGGRSGPATRPRSSRSPCGTCGDPASASAVCSSMSGLRPGCSCRNTLQMIGIARRRSGRSATCWTARPRGRSPCAARRAATLRVGWPVATVRGPLPCPPAVTSREQRARCRPGRTVRR